jgi:microsomal dipeptidase-like Zn-dependent dipeptidase
MPRLCRRIALLSLLVVFLGACSEGNNDVSEIAFLPADENTVFSVANGCYAIGMEGGERFIATSAESNSAVLAAGGSADMLPARFFFRASDLGQYLLYDQDEGYLVSDGSSLQRQTSLESDTNLVDGEVVIEDFKQSEGEWALSATADGFFNLRHILSGMYVGPDGAMTSESQAASIGLVEETGCATFPELSLDATGEVAMTEFDDGDVFGFVDTHSHLFTNLAFGGGGSFHGAPYHPLGVEHALPNCKLNHGEGGRKDFIGFAFGGGLTDFEKLLPLFIDGELTEDTHATDGYPDFTEWPSAPFSSTHQMQYYKWIERAYLSGLRLMVQHVTTNQVLCQLAIGIGAQTQRLSCNDMVTADRMIDEAYALERYVDAQSGGPGEGWFRIVFSPEEAREQIRAGNMAVVLGIETSDLFDCYLVPFQGFGRCTEEDVVAKLDEYYDKGIRVLFPVHKLDNDFSAGDGDRRIGDLGSFFHTGHFSNFIPCPADLLTFPGGFDRGGVTFAGLNMPRDEYDSPPPIDMSTFDSDPVGSLFPHIGLIAGGSLEGEYCQNHGLTDLGEFLIIEMMKRGIVLEVDHFPRKSYQQAYDLMQEYDYPAAGTHGRNKNGELYSLGGISKTGFGRCRNASTTATMDDGFQNRIQLIEDMGGYPAEGFGFDLNGFAGAPGPRFGDRAGCSDPQEDDGITYPFTSYAGDITLEQPSVANRPLDFNTEGMVHLGLVAEYIEDVRRDGVSDEELEPLFRSAEGYIRMWEKSESRGRAISEE